MATHCTTIGCSNEAIFDANICDECLARLSIKNRQNFGTPKSMQCGVCSSWLYTEDFWDHIRLHRKENDD